MTHDYKADRIRLEKTLPEMTQEQAQEFLAEQQTLLHKREGAMDFMDMIVDSLGSSKIFISRDELGDIAEKYVRQNPVMGEPGWNAHKTKVIDMTAGITPEGVAAVLSALQGNDGGKVDL
jgi:hypothetical protein